MPCFKDGKVGDFALRMVIFRQNNACINPVGDIFRRRLCHVPSRLADGNDNHPSFKSEGLAADEFFYGFIGKGCLNGSVEYLFCIR